MALYLPCLHKWRCALSHGLRPGRHLLLSSRLMMHTVRTACLFTCLRAPDVMMVTSMLHMLADLFFAAVQCHHVVFRRPYLVDHPAHEIS